MPWLQNRDLVAIIKNVTERQTEASRAAAAQARTVEEAVRTEAAKARAIAQIVAVGVKAVQQPQVSFAQCKRAECLLCAAAGAQALQALQAHHDGVQPLV